MSRIKQITDSIIQQGILPLYFNADETVSVEILRAVFKAGITAVEYTNRGETALSNFKKMVEVRNSEMPGMLLGVGTIKNLQTAKDYLSAGADFLISPGFVPAVAIHCVANDIFYAPGCMTPTEIIAAENAGISFIKLFPGNMLGPEFLSNIKDIFPNLFFMPTGGVDTTEESIKSWYKSGACAVGMGSKLISKKLMEAKDYEFIEIESKRVVALIAALKKYVMPVLIII